VVAGSVGGGYGGEGALLAGDEAVRSEVEGRGAGFAGCGFILCAEGFGSQAILFLRGALAMSAISYTSQT